MYSWVLWLKNELVETLNKSKKRTSGFDVLRFCEKWKMN
ncbi:hypothetical protein LTSERUB_4963 [Salmonella enterica subsp. enterica serovar Rubislaw str. A4-653]|uniref:Uncharacterized protein n=1 Tax=Salmonella enterica subsp. enterica serovar Rubislaw str. A4-653 TaxID=913081 RepID=G5QPK8_SALRU|nr:hypothetical protein LTSERUB_4963 [Salmonella enterica subsp. enterica serovar Rubislaw str. A4-653]